MRRVQKGKAGFMIINTATYEVRTVSGTLQELFPRLAPGKCCYLCMGESKPCPKCPASRLKDIPYSIAIQHHQISDTDTDVMAIELPPEEGNPRALLCYGELGTEEQAQWVADKRYQTILRQTNTVAFEYDLATGAQFVSPFVGEIFAGRYDHRLFSNVMLEDGVVFPADREAAIRYQDNLLRDTSTSELVLRLKGRDGVYRWYKMTASHTVDARGRKMIVGTISDVDEETRLREALRYRAEYDSLTGAWNRETYLQRLENRLRGEPDRPYQIVQLDINRFKTVNELFGNAEGDRVLRFLSDAIRRHIQPGELFGRMGNDVFSLCLTRSDEEVMAVLQELNDALNQYHLDFNFVLSAGIFRLKCYEDQPITLLCDRANLAQKSVKGNYLNRFAFYEDWMGRDFALEYTVISNMKAAIEQREFVIYLQPKVDMETGRLVGAEALARWKNPREGLMSPALFIPLFEKNGFIITLDEYIWDLTCQTLRAWLDAGLEIVPVSINVSRLHWYDTSFCDKLCRLVEKYDLDPALLEIEMTESAYAEDPASLSDAIERLREYGFTISMDDFGTGYSSLSMLKDIPIDVVKIDLRFLGRSKHEVLGREVLKATIQLAQNLHLAVIAEGVEREDQVHLLLDIGCTTAQGFFYDAPIPVKEFEEKYLIPTAVKQH